VLAFGTRVLLADGLIAQISAPARRGKTHLHAVQLQRRG
jgi:hypothetical protein